MIQLGPVCFVDIRRASSIGRFACVVLASGLIGLAHGRQVYPPAPQWSSTNSFTYAGGMAIVDLNRDGWPDVVIAQGQGVTPMTTIVHYNNSTGLPEETPSWESSDAHIHTDVDVADVNGDGWLDVAVAIDAQASGEPSAVVYLNNNGVLPASPSWASSVTSRAAGCAFGDLNADGRPDLVVVGEGVRVYMNVGGMLSETPSGSGPSGSECLWLDADDDGELDLVIPRKVPATLAEIRRVVNGQIESTPLWTAVTASWANAVAGADVTGDDVRDLLVADGLNFQTGFGSRRFEQYNGPLVGGMSPPPQWTYRHSNTARLPTSVAVGDINHDGLLDLCAGMTEARIAHYFLNVGTGFGLLPDWTRDGTDANNLVLADMDRNGVRRATATLGAHAGRRLFYLPHQPIEEILSVEVDGKTLGFDQYVYNRESSWISLGVTPKERARVSYSYSLSLDLAAACDSRSNQIFYNLLPVPCSADFDADGFVTGTDFDLYVQAFEDGNASADFDGDGFVTGIDFDQYVVAFEEGC